MDVRSGTLDYQALFEQAPGLFLLLEPDAPRFSIRDASNEYLRATLTERDKILGRGLFEVFPDNPADPHATGVRNLRASLERVLATRAPDTMPVQKYDIREPLSQGGEFVERFWSPVNAPVLSASGDVLCIIHRVEDVTDWVRKVRSGETQRDRAEELRSRSQLALSELRASTRTTEENLELALEGARMGFWDWNLRTGELIWSDRCKALLATSPETVVTYERFLGALHPEDRERVDRAVKDAVEKRTEYDAEMRVPLSDGTVRWIAARGRAFYDGNGAPVRMAGMALDITERKRAEEAFRETEERFRTMADSAPLLIWINGLEGCEFVNRGYLDFLGRSMEEVRRMDWAKFLHPDDADAYVAAYLRAFRAREIFDAEVRFLRADGVYRWLKAIGVPRHSAAGEFLGYVGCSVDITDLKEVQETLRGERARALQIARFPHENPDPVMGLARDLTVSYANPAAQSVFGLTPGAAAPREMTERARDAVTAGRRTRVDLSVGERSFSLHFVPTGGDVNIFGQDVTDRKRAENRLRHIYESGMVGILYWTTDGAITEANDKFLEMTGYTREDLEAGRIDWARMTPPEWRHLDEEALDEFKRSGISPPFEKEYIRKDGSRIPIIVGGAMLDEARHEGVAFIIDISDRKAIEKALRDSEQRFRAMFDKAALGIGEVDADDRFVAVNGSLCEILGYRCDELVGIGVHDLTAPEDRPLSDQMHSDLKQGRRDRVEHDKRYLRRDGTPLWVHVTASALRDEGGTYRGAIRTVGDVSDRKAAEAERDRLFEALREADRRKNEFLGMLSHELRNPLAPIRNSLFILSRAAPGGEQARRALAVIERQVQHTTRLVDDLLDITRITRGKVRLQSERLDLSSLVRRTAEDHRELFAKSGVHLDVVASDEELLVDADATRMSQVIGNLLQNAVKFTPRGGRTMLSVERAGRFGVITVRDTGAGIARELMPELFQPFMQAEKTLDRSAGGLGLGLALVKGLVELHGGTVSATSEGVGKGATFVAKLPLATRRKPRLTVVPAHPAPGPTRRVLVIEDNIDAAETLKEALELNDHVVDVALTGPDGIEKASSLRPDVVLCDIGLPGMDGFQVARRIRSDPRLSAVPLIALSGYAQPEDIEKSRDAGFDLHLAKPPDLRALERAIVQVQAQVSERTSTAFATPEPGTHDGA